VTAGRAPAETSAPEPQTVWLGLGTNLGDRAANLAGAVAALAPLVDVVALSGIYETDPVGYTEQPVFWNMVLKGTTRLDAATLLAAVKGLEPRLGRAATFRMGPRSIDIDILLYGSQCMASESLTVPHPGLHERAFALLPLLELDPALYDPRSGEPFAAAAAAAPEAPGVRRLGPAAELLPLDGWRQP
jgi:2-amino-4-hydroxy-6-hydroxymethyldihydropteridine diphosphokinase